MSYPPLEPVNYYEMEDEIDSLIGIKPMNRLSKVKNISKKFHIPLTIIKKELNRRDKKDTNEKIKRTKVQKWYDMPYWKDKSKCPMCNSKLVNKWEGLVCQNNCPLSFKIGKGWIYLQSDSGWSKSRMVINGCFSSNRRNYLQQRFAELRRDILRRDDYKCRMCDYSLSDDFYFKRGLCVHHIVQASEEMALYLDEKNLITLCKDCHIKIHSEDKHKFGEKNG